MVLTIVQKKIAVAGGVLLVLWLLRRSVGRRSQELIIDANINSPTFGEPMTEDQLAAESWHSAVEDAIRESSARIAAFDREQTLELRATVP